MHVFIVSVITIRSLHMVYTHALPCSTTYNKGKKGRIQMHANTCATYLLMECHGISPLAF